MGLPPSHPCWFPTGRMAGFLWENNRKNSGRLPAKASYRKFDSEGKIREEAEKIEFTPGPNSCCFRIDRQPSGTDAKRGEHFPQADLPGVNPRHDRLLVSGIYQSEGRIGTAGWAILETLDHPNVSLQGPASQQQMLSIRRRRPWSCVLVPLRPKAQGASLKVNAKQRRACRRAARYV